MPKVNPEILVWARESAGLTLEEAAKKNQRLRDGQKASAADKLNALEFGMAEPSRPVLVEMARVYRRPLLTFYLSKPPVQGERGADFRSLATGHSTADDALLDALVRDIRARQSMVRAILEEIDEAIPLDFVGSHVVGDGLPRVLASLKSLLDVELDDYRKQRNATDAFALLRERAESAGVFVLLRGNLRSHHTDIVDTDVFRGFTIADNVAPFVTINHHDARPAWSFTLLHEITHLLLGQTGVSGARAENDIERFCDDVASEFLFPLEESKELTFAQGTDFDTIAEQINARSNAANVSRTMLAYKVWRSGGIEQDMFNRLKNTFRSQWLREREERREQMRQQQSGGMVNPYVTRRHRLGQPLVGLVRRAMTSGELTTSKAATILGVRPSQVNSLIEAGRSS